MLSKSTYAKGNDMTISHQKNIKWIMTCHFKDKRNYILIKNDRKLQKTMTKMYLIGMRM